MEEPLCINEVLSDDELRWVMWRLETERDREMFGLVCKRWLRLQSSDRKKLSARAGPHMLRRMASRFCALLELDFSQSISRSFFPGVTDSDLAVIVHGFKFLRLLNLQNCKGVTDAGLCLLGQGLSSLQSLDVSYCRKLTDKGLSAIAEGCLNLKTLHLAGCRNITDTTLQSLSMNCHNLEFLGLKCCANVSDSGLTNLVQGCKKINFLDISKCNNVTDSGVHAVAKSCGSSLRTLKLLDCFKIGDESIFSLSRYCKNLETLVIGGCRDITDESMKSLADSCNDSLRNLRMDWCLNISDVSLSCILTKCKNLEALDIGCCDEVTDSAFRDLEPICLKVLKVSNCPKITVSGIKTLLEKCCALEYLDVRSLPHVTESRCEEAGLKFPDRCKVNFSGSLIDSDVLFG